MLAKDKSIEVDAYNKVEVERAKKSIGKRSCYQSF